MTHLDAETEQLKESVVQMMVLVKNQCKKSIEAFINKDDALAREVVRNEARVNAMELSIDRDCEDIFALFQPVASNLRFVLAMLKINFHLERMGDHANGIAEYALDIEVPIKREHIESIRFMEMVELADSMMDDILEALINGDTKTARKVFKKDTDMNLINKDASRVISEIVKTEPDAIRNALFLFTTIRKLERIGDLCTNVAEEIIFHQEAEVLKHNKKRKRTRQ